MEDAKERMQGKSIYRLGNEHVVDTAFIDKKIPLSYLYLFEAFLFCESSFKT